MVALADNDATMTPFGHGEVILILPILFYFNGLSNKRGDFMFETNDHISTKLGKIPAEFFFFFP